MMRAPWSIAALTLALGACSGSPMPVDIEKLRPPSAVLMRPPQPLPEPPPGDGDPAIRAEHYATVRKMYGDLADQARGLQSYARTVAKK